MGNLGDKIRGVIFVIICAVFCSKCAGDYMAGGDKKAIANYEQMLRDKSFTEAELSEQYTQRTVKVMKIPITTYDFTYTFHAGNTLYEGKHSFDSVLPTSNKIKIYYLKSNPHINCVDPVVLLAKEKEKNESNSDLYWAIGFGVIGLLALLGLFSKDEPKSEKIEQAA